MSVSNETNKVRTQGNGSETVFSFSFKIFSKTDLEVYKVVRSTDVETLMVVDVDYTVSINTVTEGGTVTFTVAPTALQDAFIKRVLDLTQPTVIPTESNFPEKSVENELDRGRMLDIQLKEEIDRCIKQDILGNADVTLPAASASAYIGWNADADALENKSAPTNVDYLGNIDFGLDASKSATPAQGDIYFATDTGNRYFCAVTNTWSNVHNGNKGTDIASSGSIDLGAATGDMVDITGTTTITALGTVAAGVVRKVRFTGALTLTYNATSLILPGAASITTAAGDTAEFISLGSGNWLCAQYTRASGVAITGSYFLEGYTTGRSILRKIALTITPGATPGTNISVINTTSTGFSYNQPSITAATDLAKGGSSGSFSLDAGGGNLTLNITPSVMAILAVHCSMHDLNNSSTTAGDIWFPQVSLTGGDNIVIKLNKAGSQSASDLTTILQAGDAVVVEIAFITST